eukprot:scaffold660_cov78-Phaeocystis_antarctica.AAC.2
MALSTTVVETAAVPSGPTKKGANLRAASGTSASLSSHRRRMAEYGQVRSPSGVSTGCRERTAMGTRLCLAFVSLMLRTSTKSNQKTRPSLRTVLRARVAGSCQMRLDHVMPCASRNGWALAQPGAVPAVPGSPPRIRHWCIHCMSAHRAVGQPGDRTSNGVASAARSSRCARRIGTLRSRSARAPSSWRICCITRRSSRPPDGAMILRPRCSSTIDLMPETCAETESPLMRSPALFGLARMNSALAMSRSSLCSDVSRSPSDCRGRKLRRDGSSRASSSNFERLVPSRLSLESRLARATRSCALRSSTSDSPRSASEAPSPRMPFEKKPVACSVRPTASARRSLSARLRSPAAERPPSGTATQPRGAASRAAAAGACEVGASHGGAAAGTAAGTAAVGLCEVGVSHGASHRVCSCVRGGWLGSAVSHGAAQVGAGAPECSRHARESGPRVWVSGWCEPSSALSAC